MRKRLKDITRLSSRARDAQVWSAWLKKNGAPCEITRRLVTHLEAVAKHCRQDFREEGLPQFKAAARELNKKLDRVKPGKILFEKAAAAALKTAAKSLDKRLEPVRRGGTPAQMHLARIRVKRLRYLLEPLARSDAKARSAAGRLRELQDLLGVLHDLHELTTCGIPPASEPARIEAERLEMKLRKDWLESGLDKRLLKACGRG
jgi:CHAD domain-containing protein